MRVLSSLLATLSLLLLVSIVVSFTVPSYRTWLRMLRDGTGAIVTSHGEGAFPTDEEGFGSTSRPLPTSVGGVRIPENISSEGAGGNEDNPLVGTNISVVASGTSLPLPEAFLNRTNGKFTLERAPNTGIFGIADIDPKEYSTYRDIGKNVKIFAFKTDSSILTDRVDEIGNLYTLRKNTSFFDSTLFFNRKSSDNIVRFIVWIDGKDVAMEVPMASYDSVRNILLGK